MNSNPFLEIQERYLRKMYELAEGIPLAPINQSDEELNVIVTFAGEHYRGVTEQLQRKGWRVLGILCK